MHLQLRKNKNNFRRKTFGSPHTSNWINLLQNCISQKYVYNLERNWKNYVCIGVERFGNLYIFKLHGCLQ